MRNMTGWFRPKSASLAALATGAVLAIIVTACGGDTTPTAAPPSPTARATAAAPTPTPTPVPTSPSATVAPGAATATPAAIPTSRPAATATAAPAPTATPRPAVSPVAVTATPSTAVPKYGGIFRVRFSGEWRIYDSRSSLGLGTVAFNMQPILGHLMYTPPDDPSKLIPDLAESWEYTQGGTVMTFRLRKDVKWHDGTPFTSKDVIFTLDKYLNPDAPTVSFQKTRLGGIQGFKATDDNTVTLTFTQPSAPFISIISAPNTLIYPAHVPFRNDTWTDKPIGTGAFRWVSYQAGGVTKYERNPSYWKKDAAGRGLPYLDGYEGYNILDRALGQAAFQTGRLECLCTGGSDLPADQLPGLQKQVPNGKYFLLRAGTLTTVQVKNTPPWDNLKVRQAIHAVIDRANINDAAVGGTGYFPPALLLPRGAGGQWAIPDADVVKMPGFRTPKDVDVALAKELLKAAGVDLSRVTPRVVYNAISPYTEIATVFASDLAKLGMKANIVGFPSANRQTELERGNFDFSMDIFATTLDDPNDAMVPQIITGGGKNFGGWSFKEIDDLIAKQQAEIDPVKRRALIIDLQRKQYENATEIPVAYFGRGFAYQGYIENIVIKRALATSSMHRVEDVWFNK